jgi:sugar phosphate isomerase/epimerase
MVMKEFMPIGVVVGGDDPIVSLKRVESLGIIEVIKKADSETGIKITCFFCHFKGQSYTDIPTIKKTVGLRNPDTRQERMKKVLTYSDFAEKLNVSILVAHIGFIPGDKDDPNYEGLVEAVRKIADYCKNNGQKFALETGQEKAYALSKFIEDVNRVNIGVNFDPANMLLYDAGDPIEALELLGKYVIGVHCKDGRRPEKEGKLGREYPLGKGDVDIERFMNKLKEIGYTGPLTIEREISGEQQTKDILEAKRLLEKLR